MAERPMARDTGRLDQPREVRRTLLPKPTVSQETFGVWSEKFARFMGTPRFLIYMTAFVALWITWNAVGPAQLRWDPYAFIFLTLMLSLQASYAAPLILLAQNRQADRDRVALEQDRARDERNLADTEYLTREVAALRNALGETATRDFVRSELRSLLEELEEMEQRRLEARSRSGSGGHERRGHDLPERDAPETGGPGRRDTQGERQDGGGPRAAGSAEEKAST